ncbi:hypothetical protein R5R35_010835 [Gryllus longicercus]|uniref:Uncharacterized protein n=1 Tax=Gryllus longicercus TaxID=2509291 RepID=A0AAN9Z7Q3_9ORTH
MGRRFMSKEKENTNLVIDPQQQNEEEVLRQQDLLVLRRVRARMQRTQRNIAKLNDNLRFLRRCAISCLDIVDNAVDIIEQERDDNRRMLQLVEQDDPTSLSSRRHTVNPMIAGYTLKRATISLQRLTSMRPLQNHQLRQSTAQIRSMLQVSDSEDDSRDGPRMNSVVSDSELLSSGEEESVSSTHSV